MSPNDNMPGTRLDQDGDMPPVTIDNVRDFVVGVDRVAPVVTGPDVPYVNFDNAATTPPFRHVLDQLRHFFEWYSSVHRGSGFKSVLSTRVYEQCRQVVADFIGADPGHHTVVFTQNATHALNKLAMRIRRPGGHVVLTTLMEHHSNMLPWRKLGPPIEYAAVRRSDGSLDMADLERKITANSGRLCLVAVTGASNVTGSMPPIRRIARLAHENGAAFALDATQLIPHRPFTMGAPDDPERVDFVAFSAHKMYAPFGCGVLVGPKKVFEQGEPDTVGGGTVHAVTADETLWASPPERDEAGTPNVPGAIALAAAIRVLQSIGMENVAEHERELTRRALGRLTKMKGILLYGPKDHALAEDHLGIVALNADGFGHGELAAILGHEWGIGVRNGCFCAQPYVRELLGISDEEMMSIIKKLAADDHATVPGMIRASFGVYNTPDEVDFFTEALAHILADGPRAQYKLDERYMDFVPDEPLPGVEEYFRL